jgi:hypothetical protein
VARISVFGRRTEDDRVADRAAAEDRVAEDERIAADDRVSAEDRLAAERRLAVQDEAGTEADVERVRIPTSRSDTDRTEVVRPVPATTTEPAPVPTTVPAQVAPVTAARTSMLATLGLILGVVAVCAALTGRLAPLALAAGVLGVLFSGAGMSATARPGVTGRGVALLGFLASVVGGLFAILAMNHTVSWLNSDADQVSQFRDWLNSRFSWLSRW